MTAEAPAALVVVKAGLLTTVQDLGRFGYQHYGVPVSGAMDWLAAELANRLVGNRPGAALLEITLGGFACSFRQPTWIAATGASVRVTLDSGQTVEQWRPFLVAGDDVMQMHRLPGSSGARSYLAVAGGIGVPTVLGSRSTFVAAGLGGLPRPVKAGDVLPIDPPVGPPLPHGVSPELVPRYGPSFSARVVPGPQDHRFSPAGHAAFRGGSYLVSPNSDRTGYRLEGPAIEHVAAADIISDPIAMGSIQVPGSGQPVILMADHRVTGGYAKIATLISVDIPFVAQLMPGNAISFEAVSVDQAIAARRDLRCRLAAAGFE